MKFTLPLLVILLLSLGCASQPNDNSVIPTENGVIPDESLANFIRTELGLAKFDPITKDKLKELNELTIGWAEPEVKSLKGLEYATDLKTLLIRNGYKIEDYSSISRLKSLNELTLYQLKLKNLKSLRNLTQLKILSLWYNDLKDISSIVHLKNLTQLSISRNPIADITPLRELTNLTDLSLVENPIIDITPLNKLTNLTTLRIGNNQVNDITPLANLTKLTTLRLHDNHISDISPLSRLTNLKQLNIFHNKVKDVSPLAGLTKLTTLELHNSFSDIAPLAGLTNLNNLYLYSNVINDISALSKLTNLIDLRLEENLISDISPLSELTDLRALRLHNNQITDIKPLHKLTNLQLLELHRNKISDISPLSQMKELKGLFLGGNDIKDITPLTGLSQLTHLGLEFNNITDISILENLNSMRELNLLQNPVQDFTPIRRLRENNLELDIKARNTRPEEWTRIYGRHETLNGLPFGAVRRLGKGGINTMLFSPDGTLLAVGTDIGLYLYEVSTGKEMDLPNENFSQVNTLAFSHDGKILASTGVSNPEIQLWDIQKQIAYYPIPVPSNGRINMYPIHSIPTMAFSKDNSTLITINHNGLIKHWDIQTSNNMASLTINAYSHKGPMAINSDGTIFATGRWNGKIGLWKTTGGEMGSWEPNILIQEKPYKTLKGHSRTFDNNSWIAKLFKIKRDSEIMCITFSPDGKKLATGSMDKDVQLWDAVKNKKLKSFQGHTGWVTAVTISNDGKYLASGDTDTIVRIWDVDKGSELAVLKDHRNCIQSLAFTPDGKTLASGSADGTIRFWNTNSGELIYAFANDHSESVKQVVFSKNGQNISRVMFNGNTKKNDIETGDEISSFRPDTHARLTYTRISSDASLLATYNLDNLIAFNHHGVKRKKNYIKYKFPGGFSTYKKENEISLWNLQNGEKLSSFLGGRDMVISPDNSILASRTNKKILLWNIEKGIESSPIIVDNRSFLFSPDGSLLIIGGDSFDGSAQIFDVKTQQNIATIYQRCEPLVFSHDGSKLICEGWNQDTIWDLTEPAVPKLIGEIDSHIDPIYTATFSPDNTILLDTRFLLYEWYSHAEIQLWDVETGEKLHKLYGHTEPINSLTFSPDEKTLASASEDGTALLWDWDEIMADVILENRWPSNNR
ncbi:leucine-rich repeat domain-containing protein [Candidatus Poribacteria bacterium]|nr:leucine-rich repeat domain-containing protein [Candidatus Poribacteria bacterium]